MARDICPRYFSRLADAVAVLRDNELLHLFSEETSLSGARCFIVSDRSSMWSSIMNTRQENRCFYEVITEHFTSRLYLDVEMINTDRCFNMSVVLPHIIHEVNAHFGASSVIVLDSSNPSKESYHLIWPEIVRDSNTHFRSFVNTLSALDICQHVLPNGEKNSIVDVIPYSIRQNFRMFNCCKKSKPFPF